MQSVLATMGNATVEVFSCGPIPEYITGSTSKMSDFAFGDFDFILDDT
jgi:hypothetical protein